MEWQLITPWQTAQPQIERRHRSASLHALAAISRVDAVLEGQVTTFPSPEPRTKVSENRTPDVSGSELDDALVEMRRKRNDRWLEERRVVRENRIEYSNPASSRILSVR